MEGNGLMSNISHMCRISSSAVAPVLVRIWGRILLWGVGGGEEYGTGAPGRREKERKQGREGKNSSYYEYFFSWSVHFILFIKWGNHHTIDL